MSEEAKNQIESLLTAIGAMGELLGAQRDAFMANGFTREEAMSLCNTTLMILLAPARHIGNSDDET